MALDGIILQAVNRELCSHLPIRINKINNVSDTEILMQVKGSQGKRQLLISAHSQFNRIHLTDKDYPIPYEPSNFVMLLRKYLENGVIISSEQVDLDRYLKFTIVGHDEIGERCEHYLYIELMGKYANIILVNEENRIMDALKRIPPFENQKRTIQPGATFTLTPSLDKKDPFTDFRFDPDHSLLEQYNGFSPLLAREVSYRLHNNETFQNIMQEISSSHTLYVYDINNQLNFHVIPLKHLNTENCQMFAIHNGMDELYYYKELKDRIRQQTGDLFKFVRKELKKNTQKKVKLVDSLNEALDCDKWREYGDLLYAYPNSVHKGDTSVELEKFDGSGTLIIPLDPRYDAKGNAKSCFKKYTKGKNGQIYIQQQIDICDREIHYFSMLNQQLNNADFKDAEEIREELIHYGYMKARRKVTKKKKEIPLNFLEIRYDDTTIIYVGKNNRQNDFLTFKKARKEDYWFHAADYHGSHTIVHTDHLDEDIIRLSAMLASYYSQARSSSSIPVNYTQVKNIKKIPEAKMGMVSMSSYKTIYIDIDKDLLRSYINLQELS